MTSQAKIDANRANSLKSSGPRSEDGKARSRMNALKHGLRSDQVVLPTEDPEAFREHLDAWLDDWKPPTMARRHLVEQAAVASWRIKRCIRLETARVSDRIIRARDASEAREQERLDEIVARLRDSDDDYPAGALAELSRTRGGVDRLHELWDQLEAAATPDGWRGYDDHHFIFLHLHGVKGGDEGAEALRDLSWRLVLRNDPDHEETEGYPPMPMAAALVSSAEIARIARAKVAELEALYETLPDEAPGLDRLAELDGLAPRSEDAAMHRYEAQQERVFRASLNQLMRLSKSAADLVETQDLEPLAPIEANAEPAPDEPAAAIEPKSEPVEAPAPIEAKSEPSSDSVRPIRPSPTAPEAGSILAGEGLPRRPPSAA